MTTEQIITLAKERLGRDITEQVAQDYIDGKTALPDEALDIVSGGGGCTLSCSVCGSGNVATSPDGEYVCLDCGHAFGYGPMIAG